MPSLKGSGGGFADLGPGVDAILGGMQRFQPGLKPIPPDEHSRGQSDQQARLQLLRVFTEVKPFRQKMQSGDNGAGGLKVKIARNKDLGDGTGEEREVGRAQEVSHFLRKRDKARAEREEDGGAKPHSRVQNTHKSQEPNHGFTVGEAAAKAKSGVRIGVQRDTAAMVGW